MVSSISMAQSMDSLFVKVPKKELPMLETNPRMDMIDLYNYNMEAKGENIFGGNSVMEKKSDNYILIRLSDVSQWEMMRLKKSDGGCILLCTHTLTDGVSGSRWNAYDEKWNKLTGFRLPSLTLDDFWMANDSISKEKQEQIREKIQPLRLVLQWHNTEETRNPILEISVGHPMLSNEMKGIFKKSLHTVSLKWNGIDFEQS